MIGQEDSPLMEDYLYAERTGDWSGVLLRERLTATNSDEAEFKRRLEKLDRANEAIESYMREGIGWKRESSPSSPSSAKH